MVKFGFKINFINDLILKIKLMKDFAKNLLYNTNRKIGVYRTKIRLFKEFVLTTKHQDYLSWSLKDDKLLFIVFIEFMLDFFIKYVMTGLLLNLAIVVEGNIGLFFKLTCGYWLLIKILTILRGAN